MSAPFPTPVVATTVQGLLGDFYDRVDTSRDWLDFVRRENLSMTEVYAFAGLLAVCRVRFYPGRRFDFDDEGMLAAVIEAYSEDAETTEDLVAWPLDRPDKFATALGIARGLGVDQAANPATYVGGKPVHVHRTPLAWLKAGCVGVVILNEKHAANWLGGALGRVAGEDEAHAREVGRLLHPFVNPKRVLYPMKEAA